MKVLIPIMKYDYLKNSIIYLKILNQIGSLTSVHK